MWKKLLDNKYFEAVMALTVIVTCVWAVASYYQHKEDVIGFENTGSSYAHVGSVTVVLPQSTDTSIWVAASAFAEVVYSGRDESLARKVLTDELASRMQYGVTVNDYINLRSYSQIRLSQKYPNMSVSRADELGRDCRGETECVITAWAEKIEFYRANSQFVAQSQ